MRPILLEDKEFSKWLSPDVINFLIDTYAVKDPKFGSLGWEYSERLPHGTWGRFSSSESMLRVNKTKTNDLFKQQVKTILHEIQHWNQFVEVTARQADVFMNTRGGPQFTKDEHRVGLTYFRTMLWKKAYDDAGGGRGRGYWNNKYEVDARTFSEVNLEGAMNRIGKLFYAQKIEGGTLDQVVEELFDEYIDTEKPLTRLQIGTTLRDYDMNTPENMRSAIEQLRSLSVKIVGMV